jgi:hypothetical protein
MVVLTFGLKDRSQELKTVEANKTANPIVG